MKKQSQFVPAGMGANPIMTGGYGDFLSAGIGENKPNQSQFDAPFSPERVPAAEKPPTAATG